LGALFGFRPVGLTQLFGDVVMFFDLVSVAATRDEHGGDELVDILDPQVDIPCVLDVERKFVICQLLEGGVEFRNPLLDVAAHGVRQKAHGVHDRSLGKHDFVVTFAAGDLVKSERIVQDLESVFLAQSVDERGFETLWKFRLLDLFLRHVTRQLERHPFRPDVACEGNLGYAASDSGQPIHNLDSVSKLDMGT